MAVPSDRWRRTGRGDVRALVPRDSRQLPLGAAANCRWQARHTPRVGGHRAAIYGWSSQLGADEMVSACGAEAGLISPAAASSGGGSRPRWVDEPVALAADYHGGSRHDMVAVLRRRYLPTFRADR